MIGKIKWALWGKAAAREYEELKAAAREYEELQARARLALPPAFAPRHIYGGSGTIHRTGTIDVQIAPNGDVEAVWFRCLNLPFRVDRRTESSPYFNPSDRVAIEEIIYVDLPREET